MAFNWIDGVLRNSQHGGTNLLTLIVLAESANRETGATWLGVKSLAKLTRTSERTVQRSLRELERTGEITTDPKSSQFKTNMYYLNSSLLHGANLTPCQSDMVTPDALHGDKNDVHGDNQGTGMVTHVSPKPLVKPLDIKPVDKPLVNPLTPKGERKNKRINYPDEFRYFCQQYPDRITQKTAYAQWERLSEEDRAAALAGLVVWQRSEHWRNGYVKSAHIWLRDRYWEDDPPKPTQNRNGNGKPKPDFVAMVRELEEQERQAHE